MRGGSATRDGFARLPAHGGKLNDNAIGRAPFGKRKRGHLRTSIGRLLMQLWPAAILAMFLALADPVHVLAETSSPRESASQGGLN